MGFDMRNYTKRLHREVNFDGTAGKGAIGTVKLFDVDSGGILVKNLACVCRTALEGASATVEVGVTGTTAGLIAQTTATDIDVNENWADNSPELGLGAVAAQNKVVTTDILLTVATADVTAGKLCFVLEYIEVVQGTIITPGT